MSDQASTVVLENEEPAQVPSDQGTQYDDKTFVKQLLDACSNNKGKYNFEDYVVEKGRGLEDVHPKTRQKCYINIYKIMRGLFLSMLGQDAQPELRNGNKIPVCSILSLA